VSELDERIEAGEFGLGPAKAQRSRRLGMLEGYSEAELLEELVRRRNRLAEDTPTQWCEECVHFITKADANERYNPCNKRHRMRFHLGEHPMGDDTGYYRTVCADREQTA
jgi:hypothetical protein